MQSNDARIAVLEDRMRRVEQSLENIDISLQALVSNFAQISGGRKALIALASVIGGVLAATAALVKVWMDFKSTGGH